MSIENKNWDQIIENWSKSGISATDFCKQQSLSRSNFYRQRSARKSTILSKTPPPKKKPESIEFIDITKTLPKIVKDKPIIKSISTPILRLTSASGVIVEVFL